MSLQIKFVYSGFYICVSVNEPLGEAEWINEKMEV